MAARRPDHQHRADPLVNAVFLRDPDRSLQVDVDVIFLLHAGIVDENIDKPDLRVC